MEQRSLHTLKEMSSSVWGAGRTGESSQSYQGRFLDQGYHRLSIGHPIGHGEFIVSAIRESPVVQTAQSLARNHEEMAELEANRDTYGYVSIV